MAVPVSGHIWTSGKLSIVPVPSLRSESCIFAMVILRSCWSEAWRGLSVLLLVRGVERWFDFGIEVAERSLVGLDGCSWLGGVVVHRESTVVACDSQLCGDYGALF